ncbi:fructose-2,6-bisphosphatase [Bernardetia litoralis DSM 6794]|uniref:Fructose-2,6-bisphosphatase n=1 Tax=Bernardetia litoralis (strain ATCC 23117 / DSM 6794 / NBRC 15988 / NCIMB 1366 / Fx l1 / Sio-4) TaxID=880071 RepID=I4AGY0_BERLS|nr:alpha-ribazole phosphatase family protein [Bernardetia litoralis]AFM03215.1 fructose-2,6-bisphosphatase [Bernardetia litoralis DSM 6794]
MEIYLIRHTMPKIEKGICYGFSDLELADSYQEELSVLSKKMIQNLKKQYYKNVKKDIQDELLIYTSPLKRCSILAKDLKINLQNYFHSKVKEDNNLKEMNFGNWELKKWNEINEIELKKWTDNFVTEFTPNGESFETLNERVIDFWQKNIKAEKDKIVLIACHAGVIRSILCHVLQIPLQKAFSVSIDYGSISKLKVFETHVQVEFLNR